jgi:hypothetical protein
MERFLSADLPEYMSLTFLILFAISYYLSRRQKYLHRQVLQHDENIRYMVEDLSEMSLHLLMRSQKENPRAHEMLDEIEEISLRSEKVASEVERKQTRLHNLNMRTPALTEEQRTSQARDRRIRSTYYFR